MKEVITKDDLAALNRYAAVCKEAQQQIEKAVDDAEKLLEIPGHLRRSSDLADELYNKCDVKAALRRMGIGVLK